MILSIKIPVKVATWQIDQAESLQNRVNRTFLRKSWYFPRNTIIKYLQFVQEHPLYSEEPLRFGGQHADCFLTFPPPWWLRLNSRQRPVWQAAQSTEKSSGASPGSGSACGFGFWSSSTWAIDRNLGWSQDISSDSTTFARRWWSDEARWLRGPVHPF